VCVVSKENQIFYSAAREGQADIVKYWIEKGANVEYQIVRCFSLAAHRNLSKTSSFYIEAVLCSVATREGHVEVVRILLETGAKHDHAIEYAAMSGSGTLMRLLLEHGENEDDALQGTFTMAVDHYSDGRNSVWCVQTVLTHA
jgi:ankyrin repeat protein